ncbi:MAG: primosomal protein N', partial [Muribaculaceae bacterium]|nr:primosomal protein N' [Muribaculaceae bacterium]
MFAEIILPLPLYSTFTYLIPSEMEGALKKGSRVLVQFGKKKYYTGLVEHIHSNAPEGYEIKSIMALLDAEPIVRYPQLKLWHWMAEYYLCSVGDIYKAAVPTGLKPESETFISLNPDFDMPEGFKLSENQALVIQSLQNKKRLKISEIETATSLKNCARIINSLMEAGILEISEKIVERYRSKKTAVIEMPINRNDSDSLHAFFELVGRSRQQEKGLIAYLELSGWMRHGEPLNEVTKEKFLSVSGISPGVLRALIDKGILKIEKKSINRFNLRPSSHKPLLAPLSPAQSSALNSLKEAFKTKPVALLHGVTGSGKTEIYTHLIASCLESGNQVLYLVPEISLTTQLTDRLRKVFGDSLLIYHSKFSDNERVDVWKRLLSSNEPLIVLGVRSSVFLPFARLGLVIVDEEHESSFKQYDPAPRYNARDASIVLASMHGAHTLLGSATPSVETYYKAIIGKYGLVSLEERYQGAALPDVEIVDMREQRKKKLNKGILSQPLRLATSDSLKEGHQAIMFQNRRGFAPVVVCQQCGWTPKCHNCDVSLVYHKNTNLLKCHYCGFCKPLPQLCPACGQNSIEIYGYGTERIAEELHQEFPDYRVARM